MYSTGCCAGFHSEVLDGRRQVAHVGGLLICHLESSVRPVQCIRRKIFTLASPAVLTLSFALAGLWETWGGSDGTEIDSGCIVTTEANTDVAPIHHRMPVIIDQNDFGRWLAGSTDEALSLMRPARDGDLETVRVGTRVNSARNDDPSLLEPERDLFGYG